MVVNIKKMFIIHNFAQINYSMSSLGKGKIQGTIKTISFRQPVESYHNYRTLNPNPTPKPHTARKQIINRKTRAETCFSSYSSAFPHSRKLHKRLFLKQDIILDEPILADDASIETFMRVVNLKSNNNIEQKMFMKTLNGIWLKDASQDYKCSKIYNTLGIRKNTSSLRSSERYHNPQSINQKVNLAQQPELKGLFPVRKISSHKKFFQSPKMMINQTEYLKTKFEGRLKQQLLKIMQNEKTVNCKFNQQQSPLKSTKHFSSTFNNELIANVDKKSIIKGRKMPIHRYI